MCVCVCVQVGTSSNKCSEREVTAGSDGSSVYCKAESLGRDTATSYWGGTT